MPKRSTQEVGVRSESVTAGLRPTSENGTSRPNGYPQVMSDIEGIVLQNSL